MNDFRKYQEMAQKLNFPDYNFNIQDEGSRPKIFDIARKKFVSLSREEWVRQHVIHYLHFEKSVPLGLMSVEAGLNLYKTFKRYDISVFDRNGQALLMVECKAPEIKIDQHVIEQALRYNLSMKVNFLYLTNGLVHLCLKLDAAAGKWKKLAQLPDFADLILATDNKSSKDQ
jgi:hypothetical protein